MEVNVMTQEETERLVELEAVIRKDLKGFVRVGLALKEIKDKKLYRGRYTQWKDYLKAEWDISKAYANCQIKACDVIAILKGYHGNPEYSDDENGHNCDTFKVLPLNERQTRPLTLLAEEQIPAAWKTVLQVTDSKPTTLAVTKVVQEILEAQLEEEKGGLQKAVLKEISVPDDFSEQFNRLIEVLALHRKSGWKDFNRKKALEFLKSIEDYLNS